MKAGIESGDLHMIPGAFLLGDSAYALQTYCIVQYQESPNLLLHQRRFNASLRSTRSTIERCIGVLKKRWACLKGLRLKPEKASRVITACACLHNFCINDPLPEEEIDLHVDIEDDVELESDYSDSSNIHETENARVRRDAIALSFS